MAEQGLFTQTVIAVIWDFDRTLSPRYMQAPLFRHYGIDEAAFWAEVNALPAYYARAGVTVQNETCYLGHLLSYVEHGIMCDLTNAKLRELGAEIEFYPGIPELFERLDAVISSREFAVGDQHVSVEHYVVSTGIKEMVLGSAIAGKVDGVWASEFIESPAPPGADLCGAPPHGPIKQVAGFLDHTTKTRAIFEINKGVNKESRISVNDSLPEDERRVPMRNMIYVADGPSDIPSFSVVRKHGGRTFAVYEPGKAAHFEQADNLQRTGRVDSIGPADYREGTQTSMWLEKQVREIARRIVRERGAALEARVASGPVHLKD